jgi:hemerythrin
MDRAMLLQHFAMTERHVAEGERLIKRQREIIAALGRKGFDTQWARELLEQLEETQTSHIAHRDRLAKELAEKPA